MAKATGFLEHGRQTIKYRPVDERLRDYKQVITPYDPETLTKQASRCMDCGIPFCHQGCPLGNLIPEWNDLVYQNRWKDAIQRLHKTNNFPEFTGTLCPAPCEGACVLGINDDAVTIKGVELSIIDRAFSENWIVPEPSAIKTGKNVAIIGSGPSGLAAAQQLCRVGHDVTVFERDDRIGGLLRYGIPEFKMEKAVIDRRLEQMTAEGVTFRTNADVGANIDAKEVKENFDVVLLAGGSTTSRDLSVVGRSLSGIHFAMEYLPLQNRICEDKSVQEPSISAAGKNVVIIGGGDTGADCIGTAHRQGAASVTSLEIMPQPPNARAVENPWPEWPRVYRIASAHEEGGERLYAISTKRFIGNEEGRVCEIELIEMRQKQSDGGGFEEVDGTATTIPCDLALLAMGFTGPEKDGVVEALGIQLNTQGNVERDNNWKTNLDNVFVAGDMQHGQSLIVWAIAEGRSAAKSIDEFLMGSSTLPAPV
jgi:glutamate synthase (NADPH/NADH) small chain